MRRKEGERGGERETGREEEREREEEGRERGKERKSLAVTPSAELLVQDVMSSHLWMALSPDGPSEQHLPSSESWRSMC